jgi:RNA-binding protein
MVSTLLSTMGVEIAAAPSGAPVSPNRELSPLLCTGNLYNAAMELSERQRKYLRGLGHALSPVLLIGNAGVTPAVIAEAKRALQDHELIKVKFRGAERAARDAGLTSLSVSTDSVMVHRIGHTALYYKRRNDRPGIVIPDA